MYFPYPTLSDRPSSAHPLSSLPSLISGSTSPLLSFTYSISMSRYDFIDHLDCILLVGQPPRG